MNRLAVTRTSDDPAIEGVDDGRGSVPQVQLGEDVSDVRLDGRLADEELFGDLAVVPTPGYQAQHLDLPLGELLGRQGCPGRGMRRSVGVEHAWSDSRVEPGRPARNRMSRPHDVIGRGLLE